MTRTNTQVILTSRPPGRVTSDNFELREVPVPTPGPGQVLIENRFVSLDPSMRSWIRDIHFFLPPVGLGEVMRAIAVGEVVASEHPDFEPGDHVKGLLGAQSIACVSGDELERVDPSVAPLSAYLGVLGMPGLTAYFGLLEVGALKASDTVLVSGAAGAVGSVAGQLAKLHGARAVGIAGGRHKCKHLIEDLGFDAAIDYETQPVHARVKQTCPKGIDLYFDNVGGSILEIAIANLANRARVVLCGGISQYNELGDIKGPANYMSLITSRARMEGFTIVDYAERNAEALAKLVPWVAQGQLRYRETVIEGLVNFVPAFSRLFSGDKIGKLVLEV